MILIGVSPLSLIGESLLNFLQYYKYHIFVEKNRCDDIGNLIKY
jgi:hypothetical protein